MHYLWQGFYVFAGIGVFYLAGLQVGFQQKYSILVNRLRMSLAFSFWTNMGVYTELILLRGPEESTLVLSVQNVLSSLMRFCTLIQPVIVFMSSLTSDWLLTDKYLSYPLHYLQSIGAMLLLWTEAFQAGYTTYSLQLHPVFGSVGWTGLQFRPQQS